MKQKFGIMVREATERDAPAIDKMRSEWYAKHGAPISPVPPMSVWMVGEYVLTGTVVAVMAITPPQFFATPESPEGTTYLSDLYCVDSREGKLGIRAIFERLDELEGRKITAVPVANEAMEKILQNIGYTVAEKVFTKGGASCQLPSSPRSSVLA